MATHFYTSSISYRAWCISYTNLFIFKTFLTKEEERWHIIPPHFRKKWLVVQKTLLQLILATTGLAKIAALWFISLISYAKRPLLWYRLQIHQILTRDFCDPFTFKLNASLFLGLLGHAQNKPQSHIWDWSRKISCSCYRILAYHRWT